MTGLTKKQSMQKKTINIFGINIDNYTKSELSEKFDSFLNGNKQNLIVTPNPEIILRAGHDEELFYIINHAQLRIPDGSGLWFAGIGLLRFIHRVTGVWITKELLLRSTNKHQIVIFNWIDGLNDSKNLKSELEKRFKDIKCLILDIKRDGLTVDWDKVNKLKPNIAFCTLGAPYQEKFFFHNLRNMPSVKIAVAVGGAFDLLTGKIKRAPKIMRVLFIEWVWRVFKQSKGKKIWRLKRIYQAAVVFPIKFCKWRFIWPFKYRSNVSCLLYKKERDGYKILVVERADQPGHWQLPQGGLDGLNLKEAGLKELREEINTNKFVFKAEFANLHKYCFPIDSPAHRGAQYTRHTGYKGQKQGLIIVEFIGTDINIKINYWDHKGWKWVNADDIMDIVHEYRKEAMRKYIKKFSNFIEQNK